MRIEDELKYLPLPGFIYIWEIGRCAERAEGLSRDISRYRNELANRILPLIEGEDVEDFDKPSALIDSIEEKAKEVQAIQELLIINCQKLREYLTMTRRGTKWIKITKRKPRQ